MSNHPAITREAAAQLNPLVSTDGKETADNVATFIELIGELRAAEAPAEVLDRGLFLATSLAAAALRFESGRLASDL